MDRSRIVLVAAAVVTLAASVFATGMALSSSGDDNASAPIVSAPAPDGSVPAGTAFSTDSAAIEITDFTFTPPDLSVPPGTEVVFTNNDSVDHQIVFDGPAFPTSPTLGQGDTYRIVVTEPGTYPYFCGIHPTMTGTITVDG